MKKLLILLALFSLVACGGENKKGGATKGGKQPLKVLYVGGSTDYYSDDDLPEGVSRDSAVMVRLDAFMDHLENHFTEADWVLANDYTEDMSAKFDVTIFDAPLKAKNERGFATGYDGRKLYFNNRTLSEGFNHPAIFIADAGERNGRAIGTKIDWY